MMTYETAPQAGTTAADESLKLVLMLYDGAIGFLNQAIVYAGKNDTRKKNQYLQKANDIIIELDNALDVQAGGDISRNLKRLYGFMNRQLVHASVNDSVQPLSDVAQMMAQLRESWQYVEASLSADAA